MIQRKRTLEERVDASTPGRVFPDEERLAIGEGKHFDEMAVLFLDICGFSALPNWTTDEQKLVLKTLNLFMGEMLTVVRDYGGTFEKNTGDGLMAYFGEGARSTAEVVKPAVEAAITMHYLNDNLLNYFLIRLDASRFSFGSELMSEPITPRRRAAIHGGSHGSPSLQLAPPPILHACSMRHIPNGGICIGEKTSTKHYQTNGPKAARQSLRALDTPVGTMAPHIRLGHLNTVLHTSPFDLEKTMTPPVSVSFGDHNYNSAGLSD